MLPLDDGAVLEPEVEEIPDQQERTAMRPHVLEELYEGALRRPRYRAQMYVRCNIIRQDVHPSKARTARRSRQGSVLDHGTTPGDRISFSIRRPVVPRDGRLRVQSTAQRPLPALDGGARSELYPGYRTIATTRVRYAETDQMGVVYHSNYLIWCEIGRTDFLRQLGTSYAVLESQGLKLAVADAHLRYHAPARYDDIIQIETWIERAQSRALTFGYEIFRTEPGPRLRLVSASTTLVALDATGSPRKLPPNLLELFRHASLQT